LAIQRFLRLASAPEPAGTADIAVEAGYADQPHLIRETRALAGLTPAASARKSLASADRASASTRAICSTPAENLAVREQLMSSGCPREPDSRKRVAKASKPAGVSSGSGSSAYI